MLRVRRIDLEQLRGRVSMAVREAGTSYPAVSDISDEDEREEVRRLMDRYGELANRPRKPGEPPRGSPEALLRHVGVISEEADEELWRIIKEARDASAKDPGFSFEASS